VLTAENAENAGKTRTERGIGFGHRDHGGGGEHGERKWAERLKTEELNGCAIQLRRKDEPAFGVGRAFRNIGAAELNGFAVQLRKNRVKSGMLKAETAGRTERLRHSATRKH
jgi:hypothetical protein